MPFPKSDIYWKQVRDFLKARIEPLEPLLAPIVFLEEFAGTYPYQCLYAVSRDVNFRWIVVHKGDMWEVEDDYLREIAREFKPVFANS